MSVKRSIGILGCGWLGFPLAERLVQKGHHVKGSTTTQEKLSVLQQAGIEPFHLAFPFSADASDESRAQLQRFVDSEILIFAIPPGRRRPDVEEYYYQLIQQVVSLLPCRKGQKILFISSTSVYGGRTGRVTEESELQPKTASGRVLVRVEEMLRDLVAVEVTILRLAGLFGPNRFPGRFLAGKTELANGDAPVNLLHLEDCIGLILGILEKALWRKVFLACAPNHPKRRIFYKEQAERMGLVPPSFLEEEQHTGKYIDGSRLANALEYKFFCPDPGTFHPGS